MQVIQLNEFNQRLLDKFANNVQILNYTGIKNPAIFKCPKGHCWKLRRAEGIFSRINACQICHPKGKLIAKNKQKNHDWFLNKLTKIHGNKIIPLDIYTSSKNTLRCRCQQGHIFITKPEYLFQGYGCRFCGYNSPNHKYYDIVKYRLIIEKKFPHIKVTATIYQGYNKKIKHHCLYHGKFFSTPDTMLNKAITGCLHCGFIQRGVKKKKPLTMLQQQIEEIHHDKVKLIGEFDGTTKKTIFQCNKGHFWHATPDSITHSKSGCPHCCYHSVSKWEKQVRFYIKFLLNKTGITVLFNPVIGSLRPDIVIPENKLIIECNGIYWHSAITGSSDDNKFRHYARRTLLEKNGYRVVFLWEDDWQKRPTALTAYLKNLLRPDICKVYDARKLNIMPINTAIANSFTDEHHPQGHTYGKVYWLGLFQENDLIACMGFSTNSRPIINKSTSAELLRYVSLGRVRGGASRLLQYYSRQNPQITHIVSFSDNDYFIGGMYEAIGFKFSGDVLPDYTTVFNNQRRHKSFTKCSNLVKLAMQNRIVFNPDTMTEASCLNFNGIRRCWNSGKKRWVYRANHGDENVRAAPTTSL